MSFISRFFAMLRGRRLETEFDDELGFHLEMKVRDNIAAGMTPEQARREAALHFGNATQVREECRRSNGIAWIATLGQDLRFGLRSLRKDLAFTAIALLALALGIGANTAVFTVIRGVMLRPLPFSQPSRLMMIYPAVPENGRLHRSASWSPHDGLELRRLSRFIEDAGLFMGGMLALTGAGQPRQTPAIQVTPAFCHVLGCKIALGRAFLESEGAPGSDAVVILRHGFWAAQFNADPNVIGRTITLDGRQRVVIGVLAPDFAFQPASFWMSVAPDVLVPLALDPAEDHNAYLQMVGRLRPGVTPRQAEAELSSLVEVLGRTKPPERRGGAVSLVALQDSVAENVRTLLLVLLGVVGLVLLIACANTANLLLARAGSRRREMAVRVSLGASRGRLIRQLLTESSLLSLSGGALGVLLSYWGVPVLLALAPAGQIPRATDIRLDSSVLLFSLAVSLFTGLLFGLVPALQAARTRIQAGLQQSSGRHQTTRAYRLQGFLVAAEIALTLVLLAGAGLLLKSFYRLTNVQTGFERHNILTVTVTLPDRIYTTPARMKRFYADVLNRIQVLPGVSASGMVNSLPLGLQWFRGDFTIEGQPPPPGDYMVGKPNVGTAYFQTMGIPLLRGRLFDAGDGETAPPVAIISESVARRFWPAADPLGHRLTLDDAKDGHWLTIVGVVGDIRQEQLSSPVRPEVYVPFQQERHPFFLDAASFVVRTSQDPSALGETMRRQIQAADPDLPIYEMATLQELVDRSAAQPRFQTRLLAVFAALALLLASVGIYGVVAYGVSQRTQEIGIRRALGAGRLDILGMLLGRNLPFVAAGLAMGLLAALAATRVLASFLFEVQPADPWVLSLAPALLILIALAASLLPARRAMRVDPNVALRYE